MRNLAFKVVDRLFIVVYGPDGPSDEEWDRYLGDVKRHGIDRTQQLIVTPGGGPNASQRGTLNNLLAGRSVPVAVMSDSTRIRGVVTALSWFNRLIRAFPPSGLHDALAYLEIPASRADLIEREIRRLQGSLGGAERAIA
jgi:hypothetical protein